MAGSKSSSKRAHRCRARNDVNDLENSPPARLVTADNLDENGLVGTNAGIAIGVPGGSPYELFASPFGYNADCSIWEVDD